MELFISKEKLIEKIIHHGSSGAESMQIASRLKKLLPKRIKSIRQKHTKERSIAKANRKTLLDKEYQRYVNEYLDLKEESMKNRVMWESYRMYYYVRKIRRYHP